MFAGQHIGIKEVEEKIWLVSFMHYDLGFFDHETGRIECAENPFGAKVMEWTPPLFTVSRVPKWKCQATTLSAGASKMNITQIGIDLAKAVFQVHGVDAHGKAVVRKQLRRAQVAAFFAQLPPCVVGMEACGGAHFWARKLAGFGHTVKLIAPQFVKPYVKTNKNDVADAEAICEAVGRPNMRFVPVKNTDQQTLLALHRARAGFVIERTAQANQVRGILAEFGLIMPIGVRSFAQKLPEILEDADNSLSVAARALIARLFQHFRVLDCQAKELEAEINDWHRLDEASQRLQAIPGIGPITASALVASVGDAKAFHNGRQFAAWLGLVPRQSSTGGKAKLLGISKRGDTYLRTLLIHGARAVLRHSQRRPALSDGWLVRLAMRRNANIATVALANKNARVVWALLAHGRKFQAHHRLGGSMVAV